MDANDAYIAVSATKSTTSAEPSHNGSGDFPARPRPRPIPITEIQRQVCLYYRISHTDLISARRSRECAHPRQVAAYLARTLTPSSLPEIGRLFHRDHTTIMFAVKAVKERLAARPGSPLNPADDIAKIKSALEAGESSTHRVITQLDRIASAGFRRSAAQGSLQGEAEYVKALDDIPGDLLELAVDRVIRGSADRRFPLPAHIRNYVETELNDLQQLALPFTTS